jgi:hypothetical protein
MRDFVRVGGDMESRSSHYKMLRSIVGQLLVVALFAFATGQTAPSTKQIGTLNGVITDFDGAPVGDAVIRMEHWGSDNLHRTKLLNELLVRSDGYGKYKIELEPGLYDVFVSDRTSSPVAKKIRIEAGKTSVYSPKLRLDRLIQIIE